MKLYKTRSDIKVSLGSFDEAILEQGGERFHIRVGNTVVDVQRGHNHSGNKEPLAIVDIYSYAKKKSRVAVSDHSLR